MNTTLIVVVDSVEMTGSLKSKKYVCAKIYTLLSNT
jgi:hypothetical protein